MHRRNEACPHMLQFKPPRIAMSLLLAAIVAQLAVPIAVPLLPTSIIGGALSAMLGFGIMLRAWWLFRVRDTAICPTAATTTLITDDVYRLTRNPMYLGIVLMLLGVAIATGGLPFYIAAASFFLIIDFVFCPYEEHKLAAEFSGKFNEYRDITRRWL